MSPKNRQISSSQVLLAVPVAFMVATSSPSFARYDIVSSGFCYSIDSEDDCLRQRFEALRDEWKRDVEFTSSMNEMVLHPAYLKIIGLGRPAVPMLLGELQSEPDYWFTALESITSENPVPADAEGDLDRMTSAWLDWGRSAGLVL